MRGEWGCFFKIFGVCRGQFPSRGVPKDRNKGKRGKSRPLALEVLRKWEKKGCFGTRGVKKEIPIVGFAETASKKSSTTFLLVDSPSLKKAQNLFCVRQFFRFFLGPVSGFHMGKGSNLTYTSIVNCSPILDIPTTSLPHDILWGRWRHSAIAPGVSALPTAAIHWQGYQRPPNPTAASEAS